MKKLDYLTSPGYLNGGDSRDNSGHFLKGSGPCTLISRKGIFKFDPVTKEMFLASNHPGITVEEIRKDIPWKLNLSPDLVETKPPSAEELEFTRRFNPVQSIGQRAARRFINRKRYPKLPEKGNAFLKELRSKFFS